MSPRPIILLAVAAVIATGLLSVGFAWSSTTLEHHTVSTGTLGLSFTNVSCSDPLGTIDLGEEQFKDVGWTECQLVDTDEDGDFDTLEINVYRAIDSLRSEMRSEMGGLRSEPELPISSCLDPSNAPSSTRAIVVSLTDAVNHPIKLTKPSLGVVS